MTDITDDMIEKAAEALKVSEADPADAEGWFRGHAKAALEAALAGRVVLGLPEPDDRVDVQTVASLRPHARWHGEDYTVSGIACSFGPKVNVRGGPYMDPDVAEWYGVALIAAARESRRLFAEVSGGVGGDTQ